MRKTPVAILSGFLLGAASAAAQTRVQPILGFPEQGLDDPAAYQGYQTRFFRDTEGNVVQVYLDARSGRVVNLLANAADESVGFTVRDGAGKPIRLEWGSATATISETGDQRTIVMLVNFTDVATTSTVPGITDLMFGPTGSIATTICCSGSTS